MRRVAHIVGNGDNAELFLREKRVGFKLACNQTPFPINDKYATVMVDFKMMNAIMKGQVEAPAGQWVLGYRPKKWMSDHPEWYMKVAHQIRDFHTDMPRYAMLGTNDVGQGYTNMSCGHVAVHYACRKLKCEEIHMYGFDSIFDFNLRSFTDLVLPSDRENTNNNRLTSNWRPIWTYMFNEFKDVKFICHHNHDKFKIKVGDNVSVKVYDQTTADQEIKFDKDGLPIMNVSSA